MTPLRLTIVQTHPVQYHAPWFRHLAAKCPELDVTVVYAARPKPEQQGVGFDMAFEWDVPLLEGYRWRLVREAEAGNDFGSGTFTGLDVAEIGAAVLESKPDVVLVPGWHSVTLVRAIRAARRHGIPVLYRGDTHLGGGPTGWRRAAWRARTRAALHMYSAYLSVGRRSREYLLANGVRPTTIFSSPHSVDNERFAARAAPHLQGEARQAARADCGASREDFLVIFVGKLTEVKRPLDLVRAVQELGPHAVLAVAGRGELEERARAEADRLGVRVAWLGFLNQGQLGRVYAAADCLAMPSESESWGLTVNEAMATGLPAVVSDGVGCAPDLVGAGETGEVFRARDHRDLARALNLVRERGGRDAMSAACRARIARYDFASASAGLVGACQALVHPATQARVIACCGGMVIVSGLERMTFEVLGVVRKHGGAVHCILNSWENHRIVPLAERLGASWSTGFYWYPFTSRPATVLGGLQMGWDVVRTSAGLLRDAFRFRPTHVLVPEYGAVLRNALALAVLKLAGVNVVFRIGNAPERGRVYDVLWKHILPPFVSRFVPNSQFSYGRLQQSGVPARKITLIRNAPSRRAVSAQTDQDVVRLASERRTILVVGQVAPFKGTHLAVDATLRLIAEGTDVQLLVVGALPIWPQELVDYTRHVQQRSAPSGRVHFVGARENVLDIMKASYVLAAPILQEETFGNVVLEAQSVGLPVVTFARGGLTELVAHDRTGLVCATADLDGLYEGLRHFIDHPDKRVAASAACMAEQSRPDNDCSPMEFERRWWALFERAS
jgi:glycosyltransferase involved in cell wall biosynthesis